MERAALVVEGGSFVVTDVAGRRHRWPAEAPRTVVLQTDLCVGARQLHGSNDALLVLDANGRTLVSAPLRPFGRAEVAAFCRATGLELRDTEIGEGQPGQPPRGPGYVALSVTRQTLWLGAAAIAAGTAAGLVGPLPFLAPFLAGIVVAFVLLFALS